jgi:CBS domain containing-hemolysin-like protein
MAMSNDRAGDNDNGHERPHGRPSLIDRLRSLFGLGGASVRDDIQEALEDTSADPDFSPLERAMLKNVLALHEVRVEDVMVPRADIISVGYYASLAEVLSVFRAAGHSRLPVQADNLDDPRGMVHIRDFVDFIAAATDEFRRSAEAQPAHLSLDEMTLAQTGIVRPVLFAPPSMPALDLLVKMQATRTHMALVIDEYGGTDGLASIEDIVEMIVGDIEDEHDETGVAIQTTPGGYLVIEGRAALGEVGEALGTNFELDEAAEDVDTIGGYLVTLAGRVPSRGELISTPNKIEFEVIDADPRRIKRVRVQPKSKDAGQKPEHGESATPLEEGAQKPASRTISAERGNEKAV